MRRIYLGATIHTGGPVGTAEALVIDGERIAFVGDAATARRIGGQDAEVVDLQGATMLPGFVDGHAHVLGTGDAARHVSLWGATDLAEVQRRIGAWAAEHPDAPRIRAHGWAHFMLPDGVPDRAMLDAIVADRPVYADAFDFHSIWLNSAALEEVGIDDATASPPGGTVHRDGEGHPTGYVDETAMHRLVEPVLDALMTDAERDLALQSALESYRSLGVTAATDMGMDEPSLAAMLRAERAGTLTTRVAGYWRVHPTGDREADLAQVATAAALVAAHDSPRLRMVGIKIMVDGTVDGCTAAVSRPYANGTLPDPIWSLEDLAPVVRAADEAGLHVAMHAIGDLAVRTAIDAIEAAIAANGARQRRHRIEHLEVVTHAEIARLAALGITASMQPVHADPAIQANWRTMLGDDRVERGFPWASISAAGARLAFGTDSPTSPEAPLPNLFVAATRRSALDAGLPANVPGEAVTLEAAMRHASHDAAWAAGGEAMHGRLEAGLLADFVVLDRDILLVPAAELLEAGVLRTVVGGVEVHGEA